MTGEEMAVIWIKENADSCRSNNMNAYEFAEQAFLAGLEAGKPKWHKVADGDLPPVRMVVFVSGSLGDMKDLHGFDEWDGEKWLNEDMHGFVRVAWCEIPTFEED